MYVHVSLSVKTSLKLLDQILSNSTAKYSRAYSVPLVNDHDLVQIYMSIKITRFLALDN